MTIEPSTEAREQAIASIVGPAIYNPFPQRQPAALSLSASCCATNA